MHPELLSLLRCPDCGGTLRLDDAAARQGTIHDGSLVCSACTRRYPVRGGVPRFVPSEGHTSHFGVQWKLFAKTQLDSVSGQPISRDRWLRFTGWDPEGVRGRTVLDVGCGSGRFAEVALSLGAQVVAVDYSLAVEACQANLGDHPRLDVVQADVYRLPFAPESFDFVYCLGVLQHTPDVTKAFMTLPRQLKPGGRLAVDLYPKLLLNWLWPKYWLRVITRWLPGRFLFRLVSWTFPVFYPISLAIGRIPRLGRKLRYAVPVANHEGVLPLSAEQLREWALLDTFDMLGPRYDQPQTLETLRAWLEAAGLENVWVKRIGFHVGRGSKSRLPAPDGRALAR
jgi:SAM-dependent methyltransferase